MKNPPAHAVPLTGLKSPTVFAVAPDQSLWIGGEQNMYHLSENIELLETITVPFAVKAIAVKDSETIYIAGLTEVMEIKKKGRNWQRLPWRIEHRITYITALCLSGNTVFMADAGQKQINAFDWAGNLLWSSPGRDLFAVPSPYFDLASDGNGGVWVGNPGRHRLENYDENGRFVSFWEPEKKNRFLGCCNPSHIAALPSGRMATLEKGHVRSRVFAASGALESITADNDQFSSSNFEYDLEVNSKGEILILDAHKKNIRVYNKV
ncbi:MAG: hypothetical protein GY866_01220 [Proteobacteria bacterium]|nr:hypothetical protein [Pseudomonadota bacterium]